MRVLVGCEFSGIVRDAFIAAGHDAMSADFLDTERPGPHYKGDVFDVIDYPWDLGIFHFPCTHTSVSGARHFAEKRMDGRQQYGVSQFMRGWRRTMHIPRVAFEHPVSVISSLFREPDQVLQLADFGIPESKAVCLWLRGLPVLVPTHIDGDMFAEPKPQEIEHRIWKLPPSPDRWKERSRFFDPIAKAMAEQWGNQSVERAA